MKKNLYFVETNAGYVVISDDGEKRRALTDGDCAELCDVLDGCDYTTDKTEKCNRAEKFLREVVEDDSSWNEYDETVDELTDGCEIIAEIETEL